MDDSADKILKDILDRIANGEIKGVSIDSRRIEPGELFVALKGDRFDGHDFVADVIRKGAWGAVVEQSALTGKLSALGGLKILFPVRDTLAALQEMARLHRRRFTFPVAGVTGSNGKTTTKEMLASILRKLGPVLKNEGNLNNHIGVPLTLLRLEARHRSAVIEMGMSAPGEIDLLARLALPDIGVITNIGPAHLEFLGSMEGVAEAKGELLANLKPGGRAVLNADDRFFNLLAGKVSGPVLSFGIEARADVRASGIGQGKDATDFTLESGRSQAQVRIRTVGRHNVSNALAAAAAAVALGVPLEAVKEGLESFAPVAMRSEIKELHGRTVLADCYNANPASMEAALASLAAFAPAGRTVAVLGDMLELGASSEEAHRAIGRIAARNRVDLLIAFGSLAKHIAEGALEAGLPRERVREADASSGAADLLRTLTHAGDTVLVKGSRGMKMEKILEEF